MPVPGDGRYEWAGFFDRDQLPSEFNPKRGWTGSANQMNLPAAYPYSERIIGLEWADASRWLRIGEVLQAQPKISLQDSMTLQNDYLSIPARRITALLGRIQSNDPKVQSAIHLLSSWNHVLSSDSSPAALFEVWFTQYLSPAVVAATTPVTAFQAIGQGDTWVIVGLLEKPDGRFGTDPEGLRDRVLTESLRAAIEQAEKLLGLDWTKWQWGKLHKAVFEHPLLNWMDEQSKTQANVETLAVGGGLTVNASSYRSSDFRMVNGPSFRMVIDVGNWDSSWAINTPGQSGIIGGAHYRDLAKDWATGKYFPLLFTPAAVQKEAELKIELSPVRSTAVQQ